MCKMGQNNIMRKCLTTLKAQIILKELHEGVAKRTFYCKYYCKKKFGCKLLVANFIQGYS